MSILRLTTYLFLFLTLTSLVKPDKVTKRFQEWYSTNSSSLILSEEQKEYSCQLRYLPVELKVFKEVKANKTIKRSEIKKMYSKFDGSYEFSFKVSKRKVTDLLTHVSEGQEDYTNRLFYLVENISNDFTLVTKQGELKPLDCHFENNYGAAPYLTFHLTFERSEENELQHLVYQDQFFGLESVVYDLNSIENLTIPKIK